jgi:hypothetical protein
MNEFIELEQKNRLREQKMPARKTVAGKIQEEKRKLIEAYVLPSPALPLEKLRSFNQT